MNKEYESIKNHLPTKCNSVLDIGCGIAGIDILLNKHYSDNSPSFYLLDKTIIDKKIFYGFNPSASFYNSLDVAKKTLISNGIAESRINLSEATADNRININQKVDIIISLISWGFHYPIKTYLDKAHNILHAGGSLIIDIRKGTNGIEELKKVFREVDVILENKSYQRILALK